MNFTNVAPECMVISKFLITFVTLIISLTIMNKSFVILDHLCGFKTFATNTATVPLPKEFPSNSFWHKHVLGYKILLVPDTKCSRSATKLFHDAMENNFEGRFKFIEIYMDCIYFVGDTFLFCKLAALCLQKQERSISHMLMFISWSFAHFNKF